MEMRDRKSRSERKDKMEIEKDKTEEERWKIGEGEEKGRQDRGKTEKTEEIEWR